MDTRIYLILVVLLLQINIQHALFMPVTRQKPVLQSTRFSNTFFLFTYVHHLLQMNERNRGLDDVPLVGSDEQIEQTGNRYRRNN